MATVVKRADGRFEIRESVVTPRGPRSRTLAIGRTLTEGTLGHAASRATRSFDRAQVLERARNLGMPVVLDDTSTLARELLGRLTAGASPPPILTRLLRDALREDAAEEVPDSVGPVAEWIGVSAEHRGVVLRELLRTADRILRSRSQPPQRRPLSFPRIDSA